MNKFQPGESDALSELVNIGFGRAASALSMLVSQRVLLDVPLVYIEPIDQLTQTLEELKNQELVNIHQVFRGKISGDAMLLMDSHSASILVDMLSGGSGSAGHLQANDQEALVEIANILVSAFIGSFGNLLRVHITFTVPDLRVESLASLMKTLVEHDEAKMYALIVKIRFRLVQGDVTGYVVIVMGVDSLETLLATMKNERFI